MNKSALKNKTLIFFSIIKSLAGKLSYEAQLIISNGAVLKQAENASKMAREMMSDQKNKVSSNLESENVLKGRVEKLESELRAAAKG